MSKNIELFYFPNSFYSQKARMYLEEKGVSYSLHRVTLPAGEHLTDEFLSLNPAGTVPVVRADGIVVSDSEEIYKFGEENFAGDNLTPSDIAPKIWSLHDELQGLNLRVITMGGAIHPSCSGEVHPSMKKIAYFATGGMKRLETRLASAKAEVVPLISAKIDQLKELKKILNDESKVSAELNRADQLLEKCAQQLEKSSGTFLFGGTLTIADIDLAVLLRRLQMLGLEDRMWTKVETRKSIVTFMEAMERRRSYKVVVKDSLNTGRDWSQLVPFFVVGGIGVAIAGLALAFVINKKVLH